MIYTCGDCGTEWEHSSDNKGYCPRAIDECKLCEREICDKCAKSVPASREVKARVCQDCFDALKYRFQLIGRAA